MSIRGKRILLRIALIFLIMAVGAPVAVWFTLSTHRPVPTEGWIPLQPAVDYRAWRLDPEDAASSLVMALRIDLASPAVRVVHRPYSAAAQRQGRHFVLSWADLEIRRHPEALALINSTRYHIGRFRENLPGAAVSAGETVVVEGVASHRHDHSYLIWWTRDGRVTLETRKPPPDPLPDGIWMGVGIQGIQVAEGAPHYQAMDIQERTLRYARSFLGLDPEKNVLWLLGFESATGDEMIDTAVEIGIPYGGQLDSGRGSSFLLGRELPGVRSYRGIRNVRPLAGYLVVETP